METIIPEKSYFRIGEVSKILNLEPYVIRYWETEFRSVKPVRTRSSQRLYRKKDVQELLTIKSDDVRGRTKAFESIIKGIDIPQSSVPESFHVLVKELNALGLSIDYAK